MSYPEKGASYRNKPAWMDRAIEGEKRARGGGIDAGSVEDRGPSRANPAPSEADWRKSKFKEDRDFYGTKVHSPVSEGSQRGISGTAVNDMAHKRGGRVRRRAEGGPLIDSKGRTLDNPGNEFMTNEPPARLVEAGSHHAAQDARDEAASRTRRSRATPNSFPVGGEPKESNSSNVVKDAITGALAGGVGGAGARAARGMGQTLGWKRGGAVKRADGGEVSKYPNKVRGLTDEQIDANESRRPPGFDASMQVNRAVPMPTVEPKERTAPMGGTPSESNKPSFLRGKKPL